MSSSEDEEVNRREVAYRLFAAEFDDANYSYAESDEERAPNYVVTPTGARVNRVFVVGVLTEVEQVSDDVVRARVVDPTGAFVVYAGQYQPEALAALESADTPSFVAVTGKARTFQPEDADVIYTSIRPEEVSEVDAETRDRWVVSTAEQTVDRVATMAAAHERVERGENLREILEAAGVQHGLAAGIPLALDHYGTTPAYLDAIRTLSLDAARVVAGERDEVGDLTLSPSDEGDADLRFAADLDIDSESADVDEKEAETTETESAEPTESEAAESDESSESGTVDADFGEGDEETEVETAPAVSETEEAPETEAESESAAEPEGEENVEASESEAKPESEPASEPTSATGPAAETPEPDEVAAEAAPEEGDAAADGEMYELSEEEREEVKENYDVGFSTGSEVPDAGESDIDVPESDEEVGEDEATEEAADEDDLGDFDADDEAFDDSQDEGADDLDDFTEDEYDEPESDSEDSEAGEMDLDLEDYVVELMDELDDGDGALRENVVSTAADERDADEGEIEDAIQEALMSGRCYESGDDHLKAI